MNTLRKIRFVMVLSVILPWTLLAAVRFYGFKGENSIDCFYHIHMADAGVGRCASRTFPQLTMSVWEHHFSDKELGFHIVLSVIRKIKRVTCVSDQPPFNSETLIFAFFAILLFVYSIHQIGQISFQKIKSSIKNNESGSLLAFPDVGYDALVYSLLLTIISPFFTDRLIMLRPHIMFLSLMLFSFTFFCSVNTRKQLVITGILGFIASWSYSNPHFIMLPALAVSFALILKKVNYRTAGFLPVSVLLGLVLGYIIHPQFPNTFINWKIQCVDVPLQILSHSSHIALGAEFRHPDKLWLVKNSPVYLIFTGTLLLLVRMTRRGGDRCIKIEELPVHLIASGIIACITVFASLISIRAMEYAAPFTLLFNASLIFDYRFRGLRLPGLVSGGKTAQYARVLIVVLAVSLCLLQVMLYHQYKGFQPLNDFKKWSERNKIIHDNSIANLVWSDFSFLIYSCPDYRYLNGLDPMFSYARFPDKMLSLEKLRTGNSAVSPAKIADITNANFAFLTKRYRRYAEKLENYGFHAVYSGPDGWLYDLRNSQRENK